MEKPDLSGLESDQHQPEFEPVLQPNNNFVGKPDLSGLEPDLSVLEPDFIRFGTGFIWFGTGFIWFGTGFISKTKLLSSLPPLINYLKLIEIDHNWSIN